MKNRKQYPFTVTVGLRSVRVMARTAGAAARRAFRLLITDGLKRDRRGRIVRYGKLRNQPQTDSTSRGWKRTSIVCTSNELESKVAA